ncbi:hypothetical protein [Enterobacter kobei]|uniref:hypothetical protein n=1 Tax=Enterobacter kobei TaxID=208224 RepID=UPI0039C07E11
MADGFSVWVPVISTLAGGVLAGGVALLVSRTNHRYAREREAIAAAERQRHELSIAEDNKAKELLFIATELVFLLEEFAERCALVAADNGEVDQEGIVVATETPPDLVLAPVTGDWRAVPAKLMYSIRELPVLRTEAGKYVSSAYENDWPPDYSRAFRERQYQYSRLGLKAVFAAVRLRKIAGLPPTRLDLTEWSTLPMLWRLWKQERKRRAEAFMRNQREIAANQLKMRQQNPPSNSGESL